MKIICRIAASIIILALIVAIPTNLASILFDRKVKNEVMALFADVSNREGEIITEEHIEGLPEPV